MLSVRVAALSTGIPARLQLQPAAHPAPEGASFLQEYRTASLRLEYENRSLERRGTTLWTLSLRDQMASCESSQRLRRVASVFLSEDATDGIQHPSRHRSVV